MKKNNLLIISVIVIMVIGVFVPSKACDRVGTPHHELSNTDVYRSNRWTEDNENLCITVHTYRNMGKAQTASCKMRGYEIRFVNVERKRLEWISVAAECKVGRRASHGNNRFFGGYELFYAEDIPGTYPPGQDNFVRWNRVVRPNSIFDVYHTYNKYRWNCDACISPETEFSAPDIVGDCCLTITYQHVNRTAFTDSVYVKPCSTVFIHQAPGFLD